jgi:uncharacterized protein YecT (DUF1311 family)
MMLHSFAKMRCAVQARHALIIALMLLLAPSGQSMAQPAAQCSAPETQSEMNACAYRDYEQADVALNAAWLPAKGFADAIGKGGDLFAAQRAWLIYRDAACKAHASPFEGGSIQPLIVATCLSELTAQRTRMLFEFHAY